MFQSTVFKFLSLGLILLLSACGGAQAAGDEGETSDVKFVKVEEVKQADEPVVESPQTETVAEPVAVVEEAAEVIETEPVAESVVEAPQADSPVEEEAEVAETTTGETVVEEEVLEAVADETMTEAAAAEETALTEAPSLEQQALLNQLNVLGQPPELLNEVWLNSEPVKLADLHGKVVIVEFWTFG